MFILLVKVIRMFKVSSICLATLILLQAPAGWAGQPVPLSQQQQALAAQIDASIAPYYKSGEPGAVVIVVKDGQPLLRKAYGLASVQEGTPLTPDMSLRLGSISKQFTAVAILLLADQGKLAVTDDITKFLPDYPTHGKKITIEQLLAHTSGIHDYTRKPEFVPNSTKDLSVAQMIDFFKNDPLDFEPGTQWSYSSSGYFLLGAIIEKASGQPYATFVEQQIFVPLGMNDTAYEGHERQPAKRAAGHIRSGEAYVPNLPLSMTQPYAAGALVSTVDDLARWDAAISDGKLLKASTWLQAFTQAKLTDGKATRSGFGWKVGTWQNTPVIHHSGGINGFATYAMRLPKEKVYVAVLENSDTGLVDPDVVARKAAAIAVGRPYPEIKVITLKPAILDAYAGVYAINDKAGYTIRNFEGNLLLQRTGRPAQRMLAYSPNGFLIENTLTTAEFERGPKGEAQLVLNDGGESKSVHERASAVEPARTVVTMTHAQFDGYVGRYALAPEVYLEVTREGDKFFAQVTGFRKLAMLPMSETAFFSNEVDAEVRFSKDASGKTEQLVLRQEGQDMPAKRVN